MGEKHEIAVVTSKVDAVPTAVVRLDISADEIGDAMGRAFADVMSVLGENGITPVGPPYARYFAFTNQRFDFEAGVPVAAPIAESGGVVNSELPACEVATLIHHGPYEQLKETYAAAEDWMAAHGWIPAGDPWEVYLTDPMSEPDASKWRTEVNFPIK